MKIVIAFNQFTFKPYKSTETNEKWWKILFKNSENEIIGVGFVSDDDIIYLSWLIFNILCDPLWEE